MKYYEQEVAKLRKSNQHLIAVSNIEWYSLFRDEIRNSIAIEGVFANRNELFNVLEKNKKTDGRKMASILGYFEAASTMYEYAQNQFKEQEFCLRMSDIKQIHTLLMRYEKERGFYVGPLGDFRKGNIEVAEATFKAIDVYYVRTAMALLIQWVNKHLKEKKYDPLLLVAISHVWFETIHPFRDGNGRVGRILLSYMLIGCGLINVAIKGISKKDRNAYYDALERSDACIEALHAKIENGDTIHIIDVDAIVREGDFTMMQRMIDERLAYAIRKLQQAKESIVNHDAIISLRELANVFHYSQDYLRNLINRGHLEGQKRGKLWYVRVGDMQRYLDEIGKAHH